MNRIDGIEERLLIFLKIAIIRGGKRFQHRQDRDQISIKPAGLAARQLRHIGILLLRHQARAGGKSVAELHETEFARAPGDQIFAQTREMHSDHRQAKKKLDRKIAIADGIDTVLARPGKAELARDRLAIEDDGRSSQRARPERQDIRSPIAITKTLRVPLKGFELGKQIMVKKIGWAR